MLSLLLLLPREIRIMEQRGRFSYRYFAICQILPLYFAISQGHPTLIIVNATNPFAFDANTTSEVHFSVENVSDDNVTYMIFVNHKPPLTRLSSLKCCLPQNCSSRDKDCECKKEGLGHKYRLKKVFKEDDSGEWTFTVLGKRISLNKTINITVRSSLEHLSVENSTESIVTEGTASGILFSVRDIPPPYRVTILHVTNTNNMRLLCVLNVSKDNCTSTDNEICQNAFRAESAHEHPKIKTFRVLVHESGQLVLQVIQVMSRKPWLKKVVNITILSSTKPTAEETEELLTQTIPASTKPTAEKTEELLTQTIPSTSKALLRSSRADYSLETSPKMETCRTQTERPRCDDIVIIVAATCLVMIFINVIYSVLFHVTARRVLQVMGVYPYGEREKETTKAYIHCTKKPQCTSNFQEEKSLGHAALGIRPSTSSSEDDASYACVYVDHTAYVPAEPEAFSIHSNNMTSDGHQGAAAMLEPSPW